MDAQRERIINKQLGKSGSIQLVSIQNASLRWRTNATNRKFQKWYEMKENHKLWVYPLGYKEQFPWYHMHISHIDAKCLVLLLVIIFQHFLHYHPSPASNPQTLEPGTCPLLTVIDINISFNLWTFVRVTVIIHCHFVLYLFKWQIQMSLAWLVTWFFSICTAEASTVTWFLPLHEWEFEMESTVKKYCSYPAWIINSQWKKRL